MTAERIVPTERGLRYYEHIKRYNLASGMVGAMKVLDAACGTGYGSNILSQYASDVTGIDVSDRAVSYAKKHFGHKGLRYEVKDATHTGYPDKAFDAVVSFETIEHIKDYEGFLTEMNRLLRPGGRLIISTPNKKTFGCGLDTPYVKYHFKEFELDEFARLLSSHGFAIRHMYGQSVSAKLRWTYTLRWILVRLPFGVGLIRAYQNMIEKTERKPDDAVVRGILGMLGLKLGYNDVRISRRLDDAIYYIAVCEKSQAAGNPVRRRADGKGKGQ